MQKTHLMWPGNAEEEEEEEEDVTISKILISRVDKSKHTAVKKNAI